MSFDAQNPYQSPDFKDHFQEARDRPPGSLSSAILIQQRVVAILLIIQGSLSLVMGIILVVIAVIFPPMLAENMRRQGGPQAEHMEVAMYVTYGVMAACGILPGLLQIVAGFLNVWLRHYVLGLLALGSGIISMGTCYCLPTALALTVYGLIIYFHATTRSAFAQAAKGKSYNQLMLEAI